MIGRDSAPFSCGDAGHACYVGPFGDLSPECLQRWLIGRSVAKCMDCVDTIAVKENKDVDCLIGTGLNELKCGYTEGPRLWGHLDQTGESLHSSPENTPKSANKLVKSK
jgi:hypothetical protein